MSLIIGENVGLRYGDQEVLRRVGFRVAEGDRIGVVGPNGEGKTSLLKIIAGLIESTSGEVHRRRDLTVGYLPQDPPAPDAHTVHDAMLDVFADLRTLEEQLRLMGDQLNDQPAQVEAYGQLQHRFEVLGGYDYHQRIRRTLTGLGFEAELWDRPLAQLSGGQRTRAYLAKLLLQTPEVLLLDEPTNHLDIDACEWLEYWLQSYKGALLVVSHDRYFLDRTTERTWEVAFQGLETYKGAYTKYVTLREERQRERMKQWEAQQQYIRETQEFIRIHLAGQRTNEAKGRRKRLERFLEQDAIERPRTHTTIRFTLPESERTGDVVMTARRLAVGYPPGPPLLRVPELELWRGQRVAIVGPNGSGKTTLLRTLLHELPALDGEVRHGSKLHIGTLSQTHQELDPDQTAMDAVNAACRGKGDDARGILGSLLLGGDDAFKKIRQLSGGQRSRVVLARLKLQKPNVLALDEPTNHLDIPSAEIIQDVLQQFDGTLLFVSHDRYLVQALATHLWVIDGGQLVALRGSWDAYLEWRAERRETRPAKPAAPAKATAPMPRAPAAERPTPQQLKQIKRRHQKLEDEIEAVETELLTLGNAISDAAERGQLDTLRKLSDTHRRLDQRLHDLWAEWEQLGETIDAPS
jgi:ATP-binding cassette, subfamily F, member 3